MKPVDRILNRSEEVVYRELQNIVQTNNMRVFSKVRLSDVLDKGAQRLSQREFDFYTRSHCDFVVTNADLQPVMAIEYDGPLHADTKQQERDAIKNALFEEAAFGLLRINDKHVTKLYRGMTVLRWIIEVIELQKGFDEAQQRGDIPADEPFDPLLLDTLDGSQRFPYWLSADAMVLINKFRAELGSDQPFGWHSFTGHRPGGISSRLSSLRFGDKVLWTKTAVRKQSLDFPHFELLHEIDNCELGIKLARFKDGKIRATTAHEFQDIFRRYCDEWIVHPSHTMGMSAAHAVFDARTGWKFDNV